MEMESLVGEGAVVSGSPGGAGRAGDGAVISPPPPHCSPCSFRGWPPRRRGGGGVRALFGGGSANPSGGHWRRSGGAALVWVLFAVVLAAAGAGPASAQSDTTAPSLQSATLLGTKVTLAYDEALDGNSTPAASAFTVKVDQTDDSTDNPVAVTLASSNPVAVSGMEVTLTLASAPTLGATDGKTTVSYTAPSANPIQDSAGNDAANLSDQAVNWAPVLATGILSTAGPINAPAGTLVHLAVEEANFVDPDGGTLTHTREWTRDDVHISRSFNATIGALFFRPRFACDLGLIDPPVGNPQITIATWTATDPQGATVSRAHVYSTSWACYLGDMTVDGSTLTIAYDRNLNTTLTPLASRFNVQKGGSRVTVTNVAVASSAVTLTLAEEVEAGETVTLTFNNDFVHGETLLTFTGTSRTASSFTRRDVTNVTAPDLTFQGATAGGTTLRLSFSQPLDTTSVPPAAAFTVTADSSPVQVTDVAISNPVILTLKSEVTANQKIRVAYHRATAGASPLQNQHGVIVPSFGSLPVNQPSVRGSWFTIPFHRKVQHFSTRIDDNGDYTGSPVQGGCTGNFAVMVDGEAWPEPSGLQWGGGDSRGDGWVSLWNQGVSSYSRCDPHSVLLWVGERITSGASQAIKTGQRVTLAYGGPVLKDDGTFVAGLRYADDDTPVPAFTVDVMNYHGTASVDGNVLTIEFGVALDESVVLDPADFEVTSSHAFGRSVPVVSASISGNTVTLVLAESIPNHATVGLFFGNRARDAHLGFEPIRSDIRDLEGNDPIHVPIEQVDTLEGITPLFAFPSIPVRVLTANTAPVVVAAGVDFGSQVLVRFNEQMDTGAFASGSAFTVTARLASGATRSIGVTGVPGYAGSKLRLHLSSAPPEGAVLTLSYRKPSASNNQLKDAGGLALESFSGVPVNNGQPRITSVDIASDPGSDGVYTAGEKVRARVSFSDNVIVNTYHGTPRLRVHLGDFQPDLRWASFESGWGTDQLVFAYTVSAADAAGGGIAQSSLGVKANSLETGGGEIWSRYVRANRSAVLSHPGYPRRPDPAPPAVTAVAITSDPGSDRTYALGDVIEVGLTFSDPILVDLSGVVSTDNDAGNDRPTLAIDLGNRVGDQKLAYYQSGHGTNRLTFAYTVTAADTSTGGVGVLADTLRLRGGLLRSYWAWSDHEADISHRGLAASRSHLVDPAPGAPAIVGVRGLWNSSTTVTLRFNKELDTSYDAWPGSIAFEITVDGERRRVAADAYPHVDYDDGRIIRFTMAERLGIGDKKVVYTKPSADALRDLFGNEVESFEWPKPVEPPPPQATAWLWGATMSPSNMPRGLGRGCSQDASLCRYNTNDVDFEYEGTTYEIAALRQAGHLLRDTDDDDSFYFALDRPWPAALRDDAALCVGTARLVLADAEYQSANRIARWAAEHHATALANVKTQLAASPVTMRLYETAQGADTTCPVTGQQLQTSLSTLAAPTVASVAIASDPGADGIYGTGDTIEISVTFTGAVDVTGSPRIDIDMDPAAWGTKQAAYSGGSGTATLTFAHTVAEPNYSSQGIAVLEDTLALNGGAIATAGGADADLSHTGLAHDSAHRVDWQAASDSDTSGLLRLSEPEPATTPEVTAVAVASDAGSDDTYRLGDVIRITVTFSEAVDVTGTPRIDIDMDPAPWGTKQAAYQSGTGTTTLVFTHTVAQPNYSSQGIAVLANTLALNSGAIQSVAADIDANLTHTGLAHNPNHKVDWR